MHLVVHKLYMLVKIRPKKQMNLHINDEKATKTDIFYRFVIFSGVKNCLMTNLLSSLYYKETKKPVKITKCTNL